jgi:hypothetical protein
VRIVRGGSADQGIPQVVRQDGLEIAIVEPDHRLHGLQTARLIPVQREKGADAVVDAETSAQDGGNVEVVSTLDPLRDGRELRSEEIEQ